MTAKDRILAENQAEAARRLEELKAAEPLGDRRENFTGVYEDRGELGMRNNDEIYGDSTKNRKPEQWAAAAEREVELERQIEKANRELEAER